MGLQSQRRIPPNKANKVRRGKLNMQVKPPSTSFTYTHGFDTGRGGVAANPVCEICVRKKKQIIGRAGHHGSCTGTYGDADLPNELSSPHS